jgi:hypothetical protein
MFTYLHHSDPTIPHYRKEEWSFLRGAAATVDRPLLGWMGRFFFHNISHDHVAHRMSKRILLVCRKLTLPRFLRWGSVLCVLDLIVLRLLGRY